VIQWDEQGQQLLSRGNAYWQRGDREEALKTFQELIDHFPDRPEGYNKMGVILAETGQLEQAEHFFLEALARDRLHVPALTNMGNICLERGDIPTAIQHYHLALEVDPEYAPAHRNLAVAYRRDGKMGAFVRHFKRSQRLEGDAERRRFLTQKGQSTGWLIYWPWILAAIGVIVILSAVVHR